MASKLSFLTALPANVRQVVMAEVTQLLQAKHGTRFTLSEQDFTDYETGTTQQAQQATQEEIDAVVKLLI